MATTETFIGQPVLRKEDPRADHRSGELHRQLDDARDAVDGDGSPALRPREDRRRSTRPRRRRCRASSASTRPATSSSARCRSSGRSPRTSRCPCTTPLATDKIRFNGDAVAVVVAETREQAIDAAEMVAVDGDRAAGGHRHREAAKDEVLIHDELGTNVGRPLEPRRRRRPVIFDSAPVIVQERYDAAPADPERDRAARVPRVRHPGDGRVDAGQLHADPAHREGDALRRLRASPSRSCA